MSEREAAAAYWSARKLGAFSRERPWSARLAAYIAELQPNTVLEFGCNVGRHMRAVQAAMPNADVYGIDITLPAVQQARRDGLHVWLGDEHTLALLGQVDVAYTVSVIDHLPEPQLALEELDRVAEHLVLVEPWLGDERKVDDIRHSPWTYSWDYQRLLPGRTWLTEPFPLHDKGVGPHYQLHHGVR